MLGLSASYVIRMFVLVSSSLHLHSSWTMLLRMDNEQDKFPSVICILVESKTQRFYVFGWGGFSHFFVWFVGGFLVIFLFDCLLGFFLLVFWGLTPERASFGGHVLNFFTFFKEYIFCCCCCLFLSKSPTHYTFYFGSSVFRFLTFH